MNHPTQRIVKALIERVADEELRTGKEIDWMAKLDPAKAEYTARDVVNAIGAALTEAGIPNNLVKP